MIRDGILFRLPFIDLPIYVFGVMVALAFLAANWLTGKELERKGDNPEIMGEVTILALVGGIVGAKMFHILENWGEFVQDPTGMLFSSGGLTFYGGLIVAAILIYWRLHARGLWPALLADALAPGLMLAYGIGRIGCHLSGDGDYGVPTSLPWGMVYDVGVVKPHAAFAGTPIAAAFPGGFVPDTTPLHPAPLYELLYSLVIVAILWRFRKHLHPAGWLFFMYLVLSGAARFAVEFIRHNNKLIGWMTQAQLIALLTMAVGLIGMVLLRRTVSPAAAGQLGSANRPGRAVGLMSDER